MFFPLCFQLNQIIVPQLYPNNVFYSIRKLYPHLSIFLTSYFLFVVEMEDTEIGVWDKGLKSVQIHLILGIFKDEEHLPKNSTLYHTIPTFNVLVRKPFENIMGKVENAGNQHFLLFFHNVFYPFPKEISFFQSHLFCRLQMLSL